MGWGESRLPECGDGGDVHPLSIRSGRCPCGRFRIAGSDVAERLVDRFPEPTVDLVERMP